MKIFLFFLSLLCYNVFFQLFRLIFFIFIITLHISQLLNVGNFSIFQLTQKLILPNFLIFCMYDILSFSTYKFPYQLIKITTSLWIQWSFELQKFFNKFSNKVGLFYLLWCKIVRYFNMVLFLQRQIFILSLFFVCF